MSELYRSYPDLEEIQLTEEASVFRGRIPSWLLPDAEAFETLWGERPGERPIVLHEGERVVVPRWHRAYGRNYEFAGSVSEALPVPAWLEPFLTWSRAAFDERSNGVLVNWYDAEYEHRIGRHKDSPIGRVPGSPILTISLGHPRTFQMLVRRKRVDIQVEGGSFVVVPQEVNARFAHAVPHLEGDEGRRISITIRCFE